MAPKPPIYLDHHATTPTDPRVVDAMRPYFDEEFGNAASRNHVYGWRADEAVTAARQQVAELIGARAKEIVFTSGATESDNLAIKGAALAARELDPKKRHLVTSTIEHKAVLDSCAALEKQGFEVTYVSPDKTGVVPAARIADALREDTIVASLMFANNEIGTLQPIAEVGALCREASVLFHCDAVQGLGRVPFDVDDVKADLVSLSSHKLYGPKGVGALFVRRRPKVPLTPLIHGGGHERGLRSGTINVAGVVGFGRACAIARDEGEAENARLGAMRDRLLERLQAELGFVELNGAASPRLAHNLNVSFWPVESESLLLALRNDVALSSGSACTSASLEPSYVLKAIGVPHDRAHCSIRFGLGRFNSEEDLERATERVIEEVRAQRERDSTWRAAKRREARRGEQEAEGST